MRYSKTKVPTKVKYTIQIAVQKGTMPRPDVGARATVVLQSAIPHATFCTFLDIWWW